jgi:hypothetical protein
MKFSLDLRIEQPRHSDEQQQFYDDILLLEHRDELQRLGAEDIGRHIKITLQPEQVDAVTLRRLTSLGFVQLANHSNLLIDLAPFSDVDAYLGTFGRKTRHHVRQVESQFAELGGRSTLVPLDQVPPAVLDEYLSRVVVSACSARGINPYNRAATRDGFFTVLAAGVGFGGEPFALLLETADGPAGFALLSANSSGLFEKERTRGLHWQRDLAPYEGALDFVLAHVRPDLEQTLDLTVLLYKEAIRFAIEQGLTLWSGGMETGLFAGNYLGVRAVKRKWGATSCICVGPSSMFFRLSSKRCFADNLDVEFGEVRNDSARQVFVLKDRSERNRLLVKRALGSLETRVLLFNDVDLEYWKTELSAGEPTSNVTVEPLDLDL